LVLSVDTDNVSRLFENSSHIIKKKSKIFFERLVYEISSRFMQLDFMASDRYACLLAVAVDYDTAVSFIDVDDVWIRNSQFFQIC